jgi:general stress protein 26
MPTTNDAQAAWGLMEKIRFCMLVTHSGHGDELRARPMSAIIDEDHGTICFLADVRQAKDDEMAANHNVCLTFADPGSSTYVSVTGRAAVSNEREKIAQLWTASASVWFNGKDDPNIRLLTVTPSQAEYWKGAGSLVTAVTFASSLLTGKRPDMGTNRKVAL